MYLVNQMNILDLPSELILSITYFLSLRERLRIRSTHSIFNLLPTIIDNLLRKTKAEYLHHRSYQQCVLWLLDKSMELVDLLIPKLESKYKTSLMIAEKGNLYLLKQLGDYLEWREIASVAAVHGHIEIIEYAAKKEALFWPSLVDDAARGGQLELVKLFISKLRAEERYWHWIIGEGARGGHIEVVRYGLDNLHLMDQSIKIGREEV